MKLKTKTWGQLRYAPNQLAQGSNPRGPTLRYCILKHIRQNHNPRLKKKMFNIVEKSGRAQLILQKKKQILGFKLSLTRLSRYYAYSSQIYGLFSCWSSILVEPELSLGWTICVNLLFEKHVNDQINKTF